MSEIKYAYQKLMAEHNLTVAELPEDAKIGITAIMNIEKAVKMAEKNGKTVSSETIAKIKANDKVFIKYYLTSRFKNGRWYTMANVLSVENQFD